VLNNPNNQKQDMFTSSIALHKVSAAKSDGFCALLEVCSIAITKALLQSVLGNAGQQCREVSKRETLAGRPMSWKRGWLSSQLTDLLEENKSQRGATST